LITALQDRDLRQRDLIPAEALRSCRATVVGMGAIGRQAALQLAALGVGALQLMDPDVVEEVNLAPQAYFEADLGLPKVDATAHLCRQLHSQIIIEPVQERFRRSLEIGQVIFVCVDSIDTRRFLWEQAGQHVPLFVDGRMSAETLRVLAASDEASRRHYGESLFAGGEAFAGSCTARSTVYCANIAAGLMVAQFARWLRGLPVETDQMVNLLAGEWVSLSVI